MEAYEILSKDPELKNMLTELVSRIQRIIRITPSPDVVDNTIKKLYDKGVQDMEVKLGINLEGRRDKISFLEGYTFDNIKDLESSMAEDLRKQLSISLMNREPTGKLKERIKNVMKVGETRAKVIARTESSRALAMGQEDAAKESKLKLRKYLSVHRDERTSGICRELHLKYGSPEKSIPLDSNFVAQYKKTSVSQSANPFHPNCRTVTVYEEVFT